MFIKLMKAIFVFITTAPSSGPPQSVMMSSVTSSSITVQWGRVSCIDRNSEITGYTVQYGQTGSSTTVMESVSGTSDSDRMFTLTGLIPRTSYTFEVAAVSSETIGHFNSSATVATAIPSGKFTVVCFCRIETFVAFLLLNGRCYEAETCNILLLLRWAFA